MREIIAQLQPRPEAKTQPVPACKGATTHHFTVDGISLDLIDVGLQRCERRKWFHHFYNVAVVLFVVDLPSYDRELSHGNYVAEILQLFANVINSDRLAETKFVLFFSGVTLFKEKLVRAPFRTHFPGYNGVGDEVEDVQKYLWRLFMGVNRKGRRLWGYFVDPYNVGNLQLVAAVVRDSAGLMTM